ncbi:MAG: alpha-galactosidase [Micromonosporaceae bacterium]|nr:alpha-galactosidase [Micromonosporaceae bacterium]
MPFEIIDDVPVAPAAALVHEHGWQSWSPTADYPVTGRAHRPAAVAGRVPLCYRAGKPPPETSFQGEGLLAVDPGDGNPIRVYAATDGLQEVPSIRAFYSDGRVLVSADGPVELLSLTGPLPAALGTWADGFARRAGVSAIRPAPTVWCSWYHYFTKVTEADILENLEAIGEHDLPVDVIQIDDGWQAEIGDWLDLSGRFSSLTGLVSRIRGAGRRAGIWAAPFLVGARSALAREHPDWLIRDADAGYNWDQSLAGLDVTHPGAADYLRRVFGMLREAGFDYYKIDFGYAAALPGPRHSAAGPLAAYRDGVRLIREAIGPQAYLLGCGAPILPSVGLVDAMRVSPDVAHEYEPSDGDLSQPSQRGAALTTIARAWQHGRWWVNDPDCLVVRPAVERREEWAEVVERYGGLRASSDRIADLDDWGLATTRRLLSETPPRIVG